MKRSLQNLQRDLARDGKNKTLNRLFWQDDRRRINETPIPQGEGYAKPDTETTLRVQNDYFTAGATFRRKDGVWSVTQCAPILNWLRKTAFPSIKTELLKRGCSWEWLPVPHDKPGRLPAGTPRSPQNPSGPTPCNKLEAHENIGDPQVRRRSETATSVAARLYSRDAQLRTRVIPYRGGGSDSRWTNSKVPEPWGETIPPSSDVESSNHQAK